MFRIIYAVERECMPEGFEDNLVFAEGEYEMMLFENDNRSGWRDASIPGTYRNYL